MVRVNEFYRSWTGYGDKFKVTIVEVSVKEPSDDKGYKEEDFEGPENYSVMSEAPETRSQDNEIQSLFLNKKISGSYN